MRFYNLDLNDIHNNNKITWRKFLILLNGLPIDSAYITFLKNDKNRNFQNIDDDLNI